MDKIAEILMDYMAGGCYLPECIHPKEKGCWSCITQAILALIASEQAEREAWYRKEIARIEQVHEASKFLELSAKDRQRALMVEALKAVKEDGPDLDADTWGKVNNALAKIDAVLLKGEGK